MSLPVLFSHWVLLWVMGAPAWAATGTITGNVQDPDQIAVEKAAIQLRTADGKTIKQTVSSDTGDFGFSGVELGDYEIVIEATGFDPYKASVHVTAGSTPPVSARLVKAAPVQEMLVKVEAKRKTIQSGPSSSATRISKESIRDLPQGDQIKLPKLISSTIPGVVPGAFGQLFIRGNHANIQYQVDGVQLPDSPSNTFGESFTPRNIDHMEVITGGIPAEFGQRLSAVVNIISKTGPEKPGGTLELNYGSYNTTSPTLTYGGSNESGRLHYYLSANFNHTERGLDTPQPVSDTNVTQGGKDSNHNVANGTNEFAKFDWLTDNENKLTFIVFHNYSHRQIPTYPSSFASTSPLFHGSDSFGNSPYLYLPPETDNRQFEHNAYFTAVWKHTFNEHSFLQVAPYWKYAYIGVVNDPANDLKGASLITNPNPTYASFGESRNVNNYGLKTDFMIRANESHLVKMGVQAQVSRARGSYSLVTAQNDGTGTVNTTAPFSDSTPNDGYMEGIYLQDDFTIAKPLVLNAGLRFDATQFNLGPGVNPSESALQPRVGLTIFPTETTRVHLFYGRLFQPAPVENLRAAFSTVGGGTPQPYDIKAERADYYEVGVTQQLPLNQTVAFTVYRKDGKNVLDDAQLLNTAIAQPINFATGYAYGAEASLRGQITDEISEYVNYSYSIAQGRGLSGGFFTGAVGASGYQFLDHSQTHTLNAGTTFRKKHYWITLLALYGSGLRTGPGNGLNLPAHFTIDSTIGYEFQGSDWYDSGLKVSIDVLNIFDNVYPVTLANGFNGSHYAAGRQFFFRLVKDF